jgi:hypothetical protein
MLPLKSSLAYPMILLLATAAPACGDSGGGTASTAAGTTSGPDGSPTSDPSATEPGSGTTPDDPTSTTHDHSTTGHDHSTTRHEHTTGTTDPASTGGTSTGDASSTTTVGDPPPIIDYCECMLSNCHDQYHETWGEDHRMAEAMCAAAAEAVPSVGMPAMNGDSIECRYYHCEAAADDEALCDAAMGAAPCM